MFCIYKTYVYIVTIFQVTQTSMVQLNVQKQQPQPPLLLQDLLMGQW